MKIKLTLDRFESDQAVLIGQDGAKAVWPKNLLPEDIKEGSALDFEITPANERENKDRQTAKDIINEIINQA